MAITSTGSLETLCVALCGQAGHPPQPARRLHQELGYFFRNSPPPAQGICLAQEKGHRRKAMGSGASVTLFPNLLSILLFFPVPTHQPRVSVLGTQEGALCDQPRPHRAASPSPHHLAWLVVPCPPSPVTGSEGPSREQPLSRPWCCDPERRADGHVGSDTTRWQTQQVALHRHPW